MLLASDPDGFGPWIHSVDVSLDGREIVLEQVEARADIVLIDRS